MGDISIRLHPYTKASDLPENAFAEVEIYPLEVALASRSRRRSSTALPLEQISSVVSVSHYLHGKHIILCRTTRPADVHDPCGMPLSRGCRVLSKTRRMLA